MFHSVCHKSIIIYEFHFLNGTTSNFVRCICVSRDIYPSITVLRATSTWPSWTWAPPRQAWTRPCAPPSGWASPRATRCSPSATASRASTKDRSGTVKSPRVLHWKSFKHFWRSVNFDILVSIPVPGRHLIFRKPICATTKTQCNYNTKLLFFPLWHPWHKCLRFASF